MDEITTADEFMVDQIDHVELFVPSRREAAAWYRRVLGLEVLSEYAFWADDPGGPLMIANQAGGSKLALFRGTPQGDRAPVGYQRLAFRLTAQGFESFLNRLPGLALIDATGRVVTSELVVDHKKALSIYFCDPYGHRLEITTYDHGEARVSLGL